MVLLHQPEKCFISWHISNLLCEETQIFSWKKNQPWENLKVNQVPRRVEDSIKIGTISFVKIGLVVVGCEGKPLKSSRSRFIKKMDF